MKLWILALCLLCTPPEEVLNVGKRYLDAPYVAGTLEVKGEERLIIDERRLDCTTFVELTVARWLAMQSDSLSWKQHVQALRYRGGRVDGYLSRLHYFTDWVVENTHRGIWHELTPEEENSIWCTDTLTLSFMSSHSDSYGYLKVHSWAVDSMRRIEQRYARYPVRYIDKKYLDLTPDRLPIHDGDILGIVTTIEGLDVTHLGFAVWRDLTLHLMHASMKQGKVVIDEQPLHDYLQNRSNCLGVRVVRLYGLDRRH